MTTRSNSGLRFAAALASAAFAAIIVWMFVLLWRYALVAPPSFDGAMNLNTALSFLHGHGYGFFYDRFFPFPAQTDGPFIIPSAIAFWIGGVTPFTTQVVNLIYVFALICVVIVLLRRLSVPLWLAVFAAMACLMTPGFAEFAMNGYGEIPMLVWFIAGLIVLLPTSSAETANSENGLSDRRLFFAGLLFGVSYITKVVALVCIGPALLVLGLAILTKPRRMRRLLLLAVGFGVPIVCWEVFRYVQLGHLHNYVEWWRYQLAQIRSQSGAKHAGPVHGRLETGLSHLNTLAQMTGVPAVALAVLIAVPVLFGFYFATRKTTEVRQRIGLGVLSVVCGLYFLWWLFITPEAYVWLRRIIAGLLLLQCLFAAVIVAAYQRFRPSGDARKPRDNAIASVAVVAFAVALFGQYRLLQAGEFVSNPPQPPGYAVDMLRVADDVRALPADATLFGTGWWQSPVIALFTGRRFMNMEHWPADKINALRDKYFVTDIYSQGIAASTIDDVLKRSTYDTVKKSDGGSIYRLKSVRSYLPFSADEERVAGLSSGFDFKKSDYPALRGVYPREERDAWMSPDAAVLLKRTNEDAVRIGLFVPPELLESAAPRAPVLEISSPGCFDHKFELTKSGPHEFELKLDCPVPEQAKPIEIDLRADVHVPFVPQIDSDNRQRSVRLRSVQLEADGAKAATGDTPTQ